MPVMPLTDGGGDGAGPEEGSDVDIAACKGVVGRRTASSCGKSALGMTRNELSKTACCTRCFSCCIRRRETGTP